jgi:O-antigen/teichoic acid export membrane protein
MNSIFFKNLKKVFGFSLIGQVIPIMITPFLTRIYDDVDFGYYSVFLSVVTIISILFSLRLDFSVFVTKTEEETNSIFNTVLSLQIPFLLLTYVFCFILYLCDFVEEENNYLYFLAPITGSLMAVFNTKLQVENKHSRYNRFVLLKTLQPVMSNLFMLIIGLFIYSNLGQVYSLVLTFIIIGSWIVYDSLKNYSLLNFSSTLFKHKRFIIYSLPADMLNALNNIGYPMLLAFFFPLKLIGVYFLALKIVRLPLTVIFNSISTVYNQESSDLIKNGDYNSLRLLTYNLQKKITIYLIPLLIIITLFSPFLFEIAFGETWRASGEMIKYFVIFIFFNGIYSPISQIGNLLHKQNILLLFNFSLIMCTVLALLIFDLEFNIMLLVISIIGSLHFLILNYYMNSVIRKLCRNN